MKIRPRVWQTTTGAWLAVAESDSVRLGVMADTETEARDLFKRALDQRLAARERAATEGSLTVPPTPYVS